MSDEKQTRERIIEVATALIRQYGDAEHVTMRDIAANAGVGVGLINYHFQTKEKLLTLCIQRIITRIIGGFDALYRSVDKLPPLEKLKFLARENASFLSGYPGLSRASIVSDMQNPSGDDNTAQTMAAYMPVLLEVCPGASATETTRKLHAFISAVQTAFLRKEVVRSATGFNFDDKASRDAWADALVEDLFGSRP